MDSISNTAYNYYNYYSNQLTTWMNQPSQNKPIEHYVKKSDEDLVNGQQYMIGKLDIINGKLDMLRNMEVKNGNKVDDKLLINQWIKILDNCEDNSEFFYEMHILLKKSQTFNWSLLFHKITENKQNIITKFYIIMYGHKPYLY